MPSWRPPETDPVAGPGWAPPASDPVISPPSTPAPPSDTPQTDAALSDVDKAFPPKPYHPPPDPWGAIWKSNAWGRAVQAARAPALPEEMAGGLADVIRATGMDLADPKKIAERSAVNLLLPPPLAIQYPQMKGVYEALSQKKPSMEVLSAAVPEVGAVKNLFGLPPGSREWWGRAAIPLGIEAAQFAAPFLEGMGALAEIPMARFRAAQAAKPDVVFPDMTAEEVAGHQARYDAAAAQLRAQGGDPVQVAKDLAKQQGVERVRWDHLADAVEQKVKDTQPQITSPLREGEIEAGSRYDKALDTLDEWHEIPPEERGEYRPPSMTREDWDHAGQFATQLQDGDLLEDADGAIWRVSRDRFGKSLLGIDPSGEFSGVVKHLYGGIDQRGGFNLSGLDTLSMSRRIDTMPPAPPAAPAHVPTAIDDAQWVEQMAAAKARWEARALSPEQEHPGGGAGAAPVPRNLLLPGNETLEQLAARAQHGKPLERPQPAPGGRPTSEEAAAEQERFQKAMPAHEPRRTLQELEEDVPKAAPEPKTFRTKPVADAFGTDMTPVSKYVIDSGGILSRTGAVKAGKLGMNKELWDDLPALKHLTHRKIYSAKGEMPDVMATNLYNKGLIPENSVGAMYRALENESRTARAQTALEKFEGEAEKTAAKQDREFSKTQTKLSKDKDSSQVLAADLGIGDKVNVDGQEFKVIDIDPDALVVTLEDGKRFGIQDFKHDEVIWGEHEPAPLEGGETDAKQRSDAQMEARTTPLGEQARPQGEEPQASRSDHVVGEESRAAPRGQIPGKEPVSTAERPVASETAPTTPEEPLIPGGLSKEQLQRARGMVQQLRPGHILETPEGQQYEVSFSKSNRPLLNKLDKAGAMTGIHIKARGSEGLRILSRSRQVMTKGLRHAADYPPQEAEDKPGPGEKPLRVIPPPSPLTTVFKPPAAKPAGQAQMAMADTIDKAFKELHEKRAISGADPGVGLSNQEITEGGRAAIAAGVNPLEVAKSDRIPVAQKYAVLRAHGEDLRADAMRLDDLARKSKDPAAKGQAELAFQKYHNWKAETEGPVEAEARRANPAMQPAVPYDIRNFTDYREHFLKANKRDMQPNEIAYARRIIKENIEKANHDLRKEIDDYSRRLGPPKDQITNDDDLRAKTAETFKKMFPCE